MKLSEKFCFRLYCLLLIGVLAWSLLGYAQGEPEVVVTQVAGDEAAVVAVVTENPPALSFWLDRLPYMKTPMFGFPLWQYAASILYIMLAVLAAKLFDWLVTTQLKRFSKKTETAVGAMVIQLLRGPVRMFALVVLLQMGLSLFAWPEWLERWLRKGLYLLLAFSLTYMLMKIVDLGTTYWKARRTANVEADRTFNELLIPLVSKSVKIFIAIMAVLVTLDNLGFNIGTLLAGVSISGLALGLAAQDTVGNLFGAAAVFVDKPFKIGDRVQLNGVDGVVEEMGLRSTRIRNLDGHLITVPNKTMGNSTITNITRRPNIKTVMNIGITYDTPTEKVEEASRILNEVYKGHEMTHDVIVGFNQFADSSLNFLVVHWWKGLVYKDYILGLQELNMTIKKRFDAAGISFAFPSRTIYLKQEEDWRVQWPNSEPGERAQGLKAG